MDPARTCDAHYCEPCDTPTTGGGAHRRVAVMSDSSWPLPGLRSRESMRESRRESMRESVAAVVAPVRLTAARLVVRGVRVARRSDGDRGPVPVADGSL